MNEPATPPIPAAIGAEPPPRRTRRLRRSALIALLAAVAVASAYALPWVHLAGDGASSLRDDVDAELERRGETLPSAAVLRKVVDHAAQRGTLRGVDLARWAGAARDFAPHAEPLGAAPDPRHLAAFDLTRGVVLGVLLGAFALAIGFALTRFRSSPSPLLAGALLVGSASLLVGLVVHALAVDLGDYVSAGAGAHVLVVGGGVLLLAGLLGMRRGTWWKTLLLFGAGAYGDVRLVGGVLDVGGAA